MMHYAVTDDFIFYLATMRGDPKVIHITYNPSISLMILKKVGEPDKYMDVGEFVKWREIEIQGKARIVRDRRERERGFSPRDRRWSDSSWIRDRPRCSMLLGWSHMS